MFPTAANNNGKRNSRDLAAAADGENFALLANSNDAGGGGVGRDTQLNAIELDRNGEFIHTDMSTVIGN